jgi:hypothetical protein
MTMTDSETSINTRLQVIFTDLLDSLLDVIQTHQVTWDEYRAATVWLTEAGAQGFEFPLMLDVFLSQTVDDNAARETLPRVGPRATSRARSTSPIPSCWSDRTSCPSATASRGSASFSRAPSARPTDRPWPARWWTCGRRARPVSTRTSTRPSPRATSGVVGLPGFTGYMTYRDLPRPLIRSRTQLCMAFASISRCRRG